MNEGILVAIAGIGVLSGYYYLVKKVLNSQPRDGSTNLFWKKPTLHSNTELSNLWCVIFGAVGGLLVSVVFDTVLPYTLLH